VRARQPSGPSQRNHLGLLDSTWLPRKISLHQTGLCYLDSSRALFRRLARLAPVARSMALPTQAAHISLPQLWTINHHPPQAFQISRLLLFALSACRQSRRIFKAMSRPLNASYCPLLPTRETDKSLPVRKKAGRGGGDRTHVPDKPFPLKNLIEDFSAAIPSAGPTDHSGLGPSQRAQGQNGGSENLQVA
jgi:hypothetical protein